MNTIGEMGRTDEELWIFSVDDSLKRRPSVNWKIPCVHFLSFFHWIFIHFSERGRRTRVYQRGTKRSNKNRQKTSQLQLRQMDRDENAAILFERVSFDSGRVQNCGTRPARSRPANNARTPMLSATSLLLNALRALSASSMSLWGAAQILGWMVGVCGGRCKKTTEPYLGTNGDGIHVFALRLLFDSVRPCLPFFHWIFIHFSERGRRTRVYQRGTKRSNKNRQKPHS